MADESDISHLPSHTGRERMMQAAELVGAINDLIDRAEALRIRVSDHPRGPMFVPVVVTLKAAHRQANDALRDLTWDLVGGDRVR